VSKMSWRLMSTAAGFVAHGNRILSMQVMSVIGTKWTVTAIETPSDSKGMSAVFDAHAHAIVSEDEPDLLSAILTAERFARKWKRSKSLAACKCGPIGKTKKRGKP
jgi:hypothetical protein